MSKSCGSCTMCCSVLAVTELGKPAGSACPHASKRGCAVYAARPESCRAFECLWLQSAEMTDDLQPCNSKVMLSVTKDGQRVVAYVDPAYPNAHKRGAMGKLLDRMVGSGIEVIVVDGDRRTLLTSEPRAYLRVIK